MNKFLIICDRGMYGCLLALIFFLPYSLAIISVFEVTMAITWMANCILLFKASSRQHWPQCLDLTAGSMLWPLIAIGLLIALTIPLSHYPFLSFKKLFTRFLFQALLMCLVIQVVRNRRRLYGVLAMLLFMVFFASFQALLQYVLAHNPVDHTPLIFGRVSGPMHHPNDLGTLLVTVLPMALVIFLRSFSAPDKKMPWIGAIAALLVLVFICTLGLTASRGAWVAFVVSTVSLGLCLKRRRIIVFIVLMLAVFFWVFGMYCLSKRIDLYNVPMTHGPVMKPSWSGPWGLPVQYNALELFSNSSGRDFYWDTAIDVIKKYPWFGCGYSAYTQTLKDLQVGHTEYPHNSLLHITAEIGILGLLLYGWLFVTLCRQGWRTLREVFFDKDLYALGCGLSCGILAWMVHSLVDTPWSSLQLGILLWLLIGMLMGLGAVRAEAGQRG